MVSITWKSAIRTVFLVSLFFSLAIPIPSNAGQPMTSLFQGSDRPTVEPALANQMMANESSGYLIYFREKTDLSPAYQMSWLERGRFVMQMLQETADRSQKNVRAYLQGQKADFSAYWIDNVIVVNSSDRVTFNGLMSFAEVEVLRARRHPTFYEPLESKVVPNSLQAVKSNLTHVNADDVWNLGYTGQGIVVANIDTGVNYTHEALVQQYRGNLGGGAFDHNYNWYDPSSGGDSSTIPNDFHNHGSHTMGTMVGSTDPANPTTAANAIGMAPGAEWIACQAFEATDQELLDCGQFMAAPHQPLRRARQSRPAPKYHQQFLGRLLHQL